MLINTKYRFIDPSLQAKAFMHVNENEAILSKIEAASMHGQIPIYWDKGDGVNIYDHYDNKYIDLTSGIFVSNAGHSNKYINKAIIDAVNNGPLTTYTYINKERVSYLQYLHQNVKNYFDKIFLMSAGTESTEAAYKLMKLGGAKNQKRKKIIISFEGCWHGRTMGAQALSYNPEQKEWMDVDFSSSILHLPFPYPWKEKYKKLDSFIEDLNDLCAQHKIDAELDIAGFMIETFQGWGALFLPKHYIQELDKFAKNNNILVCFDEMQSGFGRTGKLFGFEHYDVRPDLICCGKGISSSLPLSALMGPQWLMDLPGMGNMSSTHSGNPISCAAAHASLKFIIDNNLIQNSKNLGDEFHKILESYKDKYEFISHVDGKGLIGALHFGDKPEDKENGTKIADFVVDYCLRNGVILCRTGRESIKFGPPLLIEQDCLIEAMSVVSEALEKYNEQ